MLLEIENLNISFDTMRGKLHAIKNLSFHLKQGETLGIVGESGCGKSISSMATMGLLPNTAEVHAQKMQFEGKDLLTMSEKQRCRLRGGDMAMIFQDPMTSLNPSFTVGFQIEEVLRIHQNLSKSEAKKQVIELLNQVGIPAPESRVNSFPHQLSGGMCQRIMIAMAIACRPKLLIADEPTTALDVTIQAQILSLIQNLKREYNMGVVLITHDIGVVAQMSDRIMVMYAGQCIESGPIEQVINHSRHPYTKGLLRSLPSTQSDTHHRTRLYNIPGMVPDLVARPRGCQFHPRCNFVTDECLRFDPKLEQMDADHMARCIHPLREEQ